MQSITQRLANPSNFMALSARLLPWCWGVSGFLILVGLSLAFFGSPADYQQGQTVKIMYIHVPAAWLAMLIYALIALSSFGLLVFRHPSPMSRRRRQHDRGHLHFSALATGRFGQAMWERLGVGPASHLVLILFFLYLGLIALRSSIEEEVLAAKLTAVLSLVGIAILPVIKFSVEWNSLHQPASVMRLGAPAIHASLLRPLLVMALGMTALFVALQLKAMRNEILRRRVKALRRIAAASAADLSQQPAE
jgi:heme exporter protein C